MDFEVQIPVGHVDVMLPVEHEVRALVHEISQGHRVLMAESDAVDHPIGRGPGLHLHPRGSNHPQAAEAVQEQHQERFRCRDHPPRQVFPSHNPPSTVTIGQTTEKVVECGVGHGVGDELPTGFICCETHRLDLLQGTPREPQPVHLAGLVGTPSRFTDDDLVSEIDGFSNVHDDLAIRAGDVEALAPAFDPPIGNEQAKGVGTSGRVLIHEGSVVPNTGVYLDVFGPSPSGAVTHPHEGCNLTLKEALLTKFTGMGSFVHMWKIPQTHDRMVKRIGDTMLVCNATGYPHEPQTDERGVHLERCLINVKVANGQVTFPNGEPG